MNSSKVSFHASSSEALNRIFAKKEHCYQVVVLWLEAVEEKPL